MSTTATTTEAKACITQPQSIVSTIVEQHRWMHCIARAIKNPSSPIIEGQRIYYNHIRPHTALNGKTPAEACGIQTKGENKWLTLTQDAIVKQKVLPKTNA